MASIATVYCITSAERHTDGRGNRDAKENQWVASEAPDRVGPRRIEAEGMGASAASVAPRISSSKSKIFYYLLQLDCLDGIPCCWRCVNVARGRQIAPQRSDREGAEQLENVSKYLLLYLIALRPSAESTGA